MEAADSELLTGSADEFGEFYERHVRALTAYVSRRVEGADVAFDIVAETFARALEHRGGYDRERGPAIAWLVGIARHLILDSARRGRVDAAARRRLGMPRIELDEEQIALIEERGQIDFRDALSALPHDQQEAVIRHVLEEEPYSRIADKLGCSEQVVRKRVSRGLAQLRRTLEGQRP